jgi:predicted transcriptional regulator
MSAATSPMSIKFDRDFRDRLNTLATRHKRTAHALAREAIEMYVARAEAVDADNQAALAAWDRYQETGLHVTLEDVTTWVETWGTKAEVTPPKCHV